MTTHRVALQVNGLEHSGFKGGEVRLGLDQICSSFSLDYHDSRGAKEPLPIEDGDRCTLLIDDTVIMDGWVDDADVSYDHRTYSTAVNGRSLTCDLVDCSAGVKRTPADRTSWKNAQLSEIVADVLNPFGVQARLVGDMGPNFAKVRVKKGETCADLITRIIRPRGLVAYTVGSDLVLARAGAETTRTVIRLGDRVLRGKLHRSKAQRFSDYIFKGQTRANDAVNGVNAAQLDGRVQDLGVTRRRPLIVVKGGQDSKADLGQLAVLERNQRAGRGERLSYTVVGWEREEGLWTPNIRVRCVDSILNVDCEMLVVNVVFRFGPRDPGYVTELELTRPEAYDVIDYPVRRRRREGVRDAAATTYPPMYSNLPGGLGQGEFGPGTPSYGVLR